MRQLPITRIDSKRQALRCSFLMELDDLPRPEGDAASKLAREDLGPYSQEELNERIALLEREVERVTAHRDKASAHRLAADALFSKAAKSASD